VAVNGSGLPPTRIRLCTWLHACRTVADQLKAAANVNRRGNKCGSEFAQTGQQGVGSMESWRECAWCN
jgi:hypothetical protein